MITLFHTSVIKAGKALCVLQLTGIGVVFLTVAFLSSLASSQDSSKSNSSDEPDSLVALGLNNNAEISESSGLARSAHVDGAIWTINDSGHPAKLFLLKHDGRLLAKVAVPMSKNRDWEALTRFSLNNRNYLMIADVGDNLKRTKVYDLYWMEEPNLSSDVHSIKVVSLAAMSTKLQFTYPDGSKNCEAVAVDEAGKQIWLVEKVYFDSTQKTPPGIYVLPLELTPTETPRVARRVGDFPIRNVTGMAFSPDGKRLLIRNYVTAHLYSRETDETWEDVLSRFKPATVVLPLQRQGEAVCFSKDSKSVILTSELKGQQIWQVSLNKYFDQPRVEKKSSKTNDK